MTVSAASRVIDITVLCIWLGSHSWAKMGTTASPWGPDSHQLEEWGSVLLPLPHSV